MSCKNSVEARNLPDKMNAGTNSVEDINTLLSLAKGDLQNAKAKCSQALPSREPSLLDPLKDAGESSPSERVAVISVKCLQLKPNDALVVSNRNSSADVGQEMHADKAGGPAASEERRIEPGGKSFNCPACRQNVTGSNDDIVGHLYQHSRALARLCRECGLQTKSANAMIRHVMKHANGQSASVLDGKTSLDDLQRLYACVVCGSRFKFCGHLKTHLYLHMDEKRFQCLICSACFTRKNYMRRHTWNVHGIHLVSEEELETIETDLTSAEAEAATTGPPMNTTENCEVTEGSEDARLLRNRRMCSACGQHFRFQSQLEVHQKIHRKTKAVHKCDFCDKTLFSRKLLMQHRVLKHGVRDTSHSRGHQCSVCGAKIFGTSFFAKHLLEHVDEMEQGLEHPPAKPGDLTCDEAAQTERDRLDEPEPITHREVSGKKELSRRGVKSSDVFLMAPKSKLSSRVQRKCRTQLKFLHEGKGTKSSPEAGNSASGLELYVCLKCDVAFADREQYQEHIDGHEEKKKFSCLSCPENFLTSEDLKAHVSVHAKNIVVGPANCKSAAASSSAPSAASDENSELPDQKYKEDVTGYCSFCQVAFSSLGFLTHHMSTAHSDVPTYTLEQASEGDQEGMITAHILQ